jgi:hypothetical protein
LVESRTYVEELAVFASASEIPAPTASVDVSLKPAPATTEMAVSRSP